jgi:hypothetical protein
MGHHYIMNLIIYLFAFSHSNESQPRGGKSLPS